jgi:hypothetical protein
VSEKPLHVQVAEALGWTDLRPQTWDIGGTKYVRDEWGGILFDKPGDTVPRVWGRVPRYDTDWSATGPLIEKYGINLTGPRPWDACRGHDREGFHDEPNGEGPTPLIAVCNLLLALKAAGKLEPSA